MTSLVLRDSIFYIQHMVSGKAKRLSTGTDSLQIAKAKLRQFEEEKANGDDNPLPTRTPIASVVTAYVEHIKNVKTRKSANTDTYYLRDAFGPICDALKSPRRKISAKAKKRPPKPGQDRRRKATPIGATCFEQIRTADIAGFISAQMISRRLAPKTANRYREILTRLFNWAMTQYGVKIPRDKNPASAVERYKERAPEISFLTLEPIEAQLTALSDNVKMQAMVATLIFAGLRREELLWLQPEDIDWEAGTSGLIRIRAETVGDERWQPKTKQNRGVPISSRLRTYLDKWRLKHHGGTWFFPNSEGNRPFHVIRRGLLKAVIWQNQTTNGSMFSTQLIRVYKDGDDWKETHSLNRENLLHAAKLLDAADSIIHREEEERREQQNSN